MRPPHITTTWPEEAARARRNASRQSAASKRQRSRELTRAGRGLRAAGKSWRQIARELGKGTTTVREAYWAYGPVNK